MRFKRTIFKKIRFMCVIITYRDHIPISNKMVFKTDDEIEDMIYDIINDCRETINMALIMNRQTL